MELTPGKPGPKAREGRSRTVEFQYGGRKFAAVLQGAELVLREMRRGGPETVESGRVVGKEIQMRRPLSPDLHEAMRGAIFGATPTPTPSTTKTAIVTGTAQAPGRLAVGNEVVEIRPGDTGEQITQRVAEARAKAAAVPPTMEAAAADLGVELTPGVRAFGKMFEAAARREPLAPALPEGVELPPVAVTVKPQLPAHAFEWKAPEITPAPVVEAPAPANPEITPAAAARFAETAGAIDPPRRTARGGQLEVALPELPAPQHVEVYVGPPRAAQVERLDACILAALVALREGIKSSDWACVRVAAAILNETGGAR